MFSFKTFLHMMVCLHLCICTMCLPMEARRGLESPGIGIMDSWEPPCGFWELTLGVLQMSLIAMPSKFLKLIHTSHNS